MTWILIIDSEHSGAYNMSFDGYFLENTIQYPMLRFYDWNPTAVSIGYHQKLKYYDKNKFQDLGIDIVRRPTGGRAVLHNNEITYSVIIPESSEYFKLSIHELYYEISKAINAGLNDAGIETEIERNRPNGMKRIRSQLKCFDSTARFEIKNNGSKLVGSAQRRLNTGILQHGSILLQDQQNILTYLFSQDLNKEEVITSQLKNSKCDIANSGIKKTDIINSIINGFVRELKCNFTMDFDVNTYIEYINDHQEEYSIYSINDQKM